MSKFINTIKLSNQLAITDFKLKNEGSFLGLLWYVFNPILLFTLVYFVFNNNLGSNIHYYSLYLLLGILMFNFFQSITLESIRTIINENHYLIKSINFPRESLVIAIVIKNIFSHLIEILLFGILLAFFGINFLNIFLYLIILFFFSLFLIGLSLILSSATVYVVDLDNIWNFATKLLLFATPIFYVIENNIYLFYANLINPLFYYLSFARDIIIYNSIPELYIIYGSILFSIIFFILGIFIFKKLNKRMAELI
jgi:ABC-type polysaccharide/polyol phosphate export permease